MLFCCKHIRSCLFLLYLQNAFYPIYSYLCHCRTDRICAGTVGKISDLFQTLTGFKSCFPYLFSKPEKGPSYNYSKTCPHFQKSALYLTRQCHQQNDGCVNCFHSFLLQFLFSLSFFIYFFYTSVGYCFPPCGPSSLLCSCSFGHARAWTVGVFLLMYL